MAIKGSALAMALFVWMIGIFLGSTYDGYGAAGSAYAWAGNSTADNAGGYEYSPAMTLSYIMTGETTFQRTSELGEVTLPKPKFSDYWNMWWAVALWDFSFMQNFQMVRWIIFLPIGAVIISSLLMWMAKLIRGNIGFG